MNIAEEIIITGSVMTALGVIMAAAVKVYGFIKRIWHLKLLNIAMLICTIAQNGW